MEELGDALRLRGAGNGKNDETLVPAVVQREGTRPHAPGGRFFIAAPGPTRLTGGGFHWTPETFRVTSFSRSWIVFGTGIAD